MTIRTAIRHPIIERCQQSSGHASQEAWPLEDRRRRCLIDLNWTVSFNHRPLKNGA